MAAVRKTDVGTETVTKVQEKPSAEARKGFEKSPTDTVKLDTTQVAVADDSNAMGEGLSPMRADGKASTNVDPTPVDNADFDDQTFANQYTQTSMSPGITSDSLTVGAQMASNPKGKEAKVVDEPGKPKGIIVKEGESPKFSGTVVGSKVVVEENVYLESQAPHSKRKMYTLLFAKGTSVPVADTAE